MSNTCPSCHRPYEGRVCARCHGETQLPDAAPAKQALDVGATLAGRYRLVARIGGGASGDVYAAEHLMTGGKVAIKVLRSDRATSEQASRRFMFEARATHGLHHPNTVRIVDLGIETDGIPWLVMEWLEGRTLAEVIAGDGPMPVERALRLARQLLGSLAEAHAARIVHRDIKPQNLLLLDVRGGSDADHLKVLDFGIARDLDREDGHTMHPVGTPRYMAPEVWLGAPAAPAVDVYASGCVLFHMITGGSVLDGADETAPSSGDEVARYCARIQQQLDARDVDDAVVDVIVAMVSPNRSTRPKDAGEALARLNAAATTLRLETHATPKRRTAALLATGGLLGLIGAALALVVATSTPTAQTHTDRMASADDSDIPVNPRPQTRDEGSPPAEPVPVPKLPSQTETETNTTRLTAEAPPDDRPQPPDATPHIQLRISPTHARVAFHGGPFMAPPDTIPLPQEDQKISAVVRAAGYDTLRTTLDAKSASQLADGVWSLVLRRSPVASKPAPQLNLDGLDIPAPAAHGSTP